MTYYGCVRHCAYVRALASPLPPGAGESATLAASPEAETLLTVYAVVMGNVKPTPTASSGSSQSAVETPPADKLLPATWSKVKPESCRQYPKAVTLFVVDDEVLYPDTAQELLVPDVRWLL